MHANPFGERYPALDKAPGATDLACTQHIRSRPISAVAAQGNPVPGHSHSYNGLPQLPHFYFVQSSSPSLAGGNRGRGGDLGTSRSAVRTHPRIHTRRIGRHRAAILAALPACLPTPGSTVRRPSAIRRPIHPFPTSPPPFVCPTAACFSCCPLYKSLFAQPLPSAA